MSNNNFGPLNDPSQLPRVGYQVVSCDEPDFSGMPIPKGIPKNLGVMNGGPVASLSATSNVPRAITTTSTTSAVSVPVVQARTTTTTTTTTTTPSTNVVNNNNNSSGHGLEFGTVIRVPKAPSFAGISIPKLMPKNLGSYFSNIAGAGQLNPTGPVTPTAAPSQAPAIPQVVPSRVQTSVATTPAVPPTPATASCQVGRNPVPYTGNIVVPNGNNIQVVHHEARPIRDAEIQQQVAISVPADESGLGEIISQVYLLLIGMAQLEVKMGTFPSILTVNQQVEVQQIINDFNIKKMLVLSSLLDKVGSRATIEGGIHRRLSVDVSNYSALDASQKHLIDRILSLLKLSMDEVTIMTHNKLADDVCELTCEIVLVNLGLLSNPARSVASIELELASKLLQLHSLQATRESMDNYIFNKICNIVNCAIINLHINRASPMLIQLFVEDKNAKKVLFDITLNNVISKFFGSN